MCPGMAGMGDMDMPGLGVMPVEVNGEEMLMTEVTQLFGSHGIISARVMASALPIGCRGRPHS